MNAQSFSHAFHVATVSFADFRFAGGRAFANERLRVFRETGCRFVVDGCKRR